MKISSDEILNMHLGGKIGLRLKCEMKTQKDLSMAYTPGVAEICKLIENQPKKIFEYTAKGKMVAVMTDGTAVLGLGNIGAKASIPVMEGKAVLFKRFGDVDAWPMVFDNIAKQPEKFIEMAKSVSVMYGGINLEDIAAPECFEIEERLSSELDIPVFHDDQWGTAIIILAAIKNYCILSSKNIENIRIVISGAGAAGIRTADMLKNSGAKNIVMLDSKGVIHIGRDDINDFKKKHAVSTNVRTLQEALKEADVFIGVSCAGCLKKEWVPSMADYPAIFAMANPTPEIMPEEVAEVMKERKYVMATGRSDYPNQINNVLGFPYIFKGALDAKATKITMSMKEAASDAIAELARIGNIPEEVNSCYENKQFVFGPDYLIPVPFDPRLKDFVSSRVAEAAKKSGFVRTEK